MKRLFTFIFLLALSNINHSQEIDPSIISGLGDEEITALRNQLSNGSMQISNLSDADTSVTESTVKESPEDIPDPNNSPDKKYGYDFFTSVPTTITAVGDLPLPNDYKISLKDTLTVILSGSKDALFDLDVKLDGSILFPELGSIYVVNETLGDIKDKLARLIEQSYIGVQIDISIKELAAKKITIVGAVKTPGTYLVNPFSTISSALGYSGGISEIGTLRNIRLIRTSGESYIFDLYKLLIDGDRSDDITIEAGDVIVVGPANQFVKLSGEIRRPAIYEIAKDEVLDDLINFGLGFTNIANKSNIIIQSLDIESASIASSSSDNLSINLDNVLDVLVNKIVNKTIPRVEVRGAIKEPGLYNLDEVGTLTDLIEKVEFVDTYPWLAVLEQFDENNLIKSTFLFSLKDIDTYSSIDLLPNSKIFFANTQERSYEVSEISQNLINDFSLTINYKNSSFSLPVIGNFNLVDFINLLGLDMSDVEDEVIYVSPLDNIVRSENYFDMSLKSSKYHNVSLRSQVNDLIRVSISGAVDFPGTYTLKSDSTLIDLYNQIGDFKEDAFLDGIILKRDSVRERQISSLEKSRRDLNEFVFSNLSQGIAVEDITFANSIANSIDLENLGRISGDYSPGSIGSQKTTLSDGDTVIVPRIPNVISVLGEVLSPITFEFSSRMSINEAIQNAGGFKTYADKSRIYVIKANGLIEKESRNIFKGNINLESGDTIIVPRKMVGVTPITQALLPITSILSDLAFSAAAVESLSNN